MAIGQCVKLLGCAILQDASPSVIVTKDAHGTAVAKEALKLADEGGAKEIRESSAVVMEVCVCVGGGWGGDINSSSCQRHMPLLSEFSVRFKMAAMVARLLFHG